MERLSLKVDQHILYHDHVVLRTHCTLVVCCDPRGAEGEGSFMHIR